MLVTRQKLITCPCCQSDFFINYADEFYTLPLSDEEKKFLEERKLSDDKVGVKTLFF